MDKAFSIEEIKDVVFSIKNSKLRGPDGIPIEFYQTCWDIIKHDLFALFCDFHQHNIDLDRINYGTIILLPKSDDGNVTQNIDPFVCSKYFL
jgi:hypothetical protein